MRELDFIVKNVFFDNIGVFFLPHPRKNEKQTLPWIPVNWGKTFTHIPYYYPPSTRTINNNHNNNNNSTII